MKDQRLVPLSALQHFAFCPRQCALIHNEQLWSDNWLTAQGQVLHQRVDHGEPETRKGIRFERGVLVSAEKLGLTGKLDLVEVDQTTGEHKPIEYKRGKPKQGNWDRVQLCAQALCLEEMLATTVTEGALWYWQTRRRLSVPITPELRQETLAFIQSVTALFQSGQTPRARYEKKCDACSLYDVCNPKLTGRDRSADYFDGLFNTDDVQ